jgi:calcineurin-like phosphoesterase
MPIRFNLAQADVRMQGVIVEADDLTGKALSMKRVEYRQDDK